METEWLWGLLGGLMIGGAAALYLLVNGRVMGASGIIGGLVDGSGRNAWGERVAFLVGLIGAPGLAVLIFGGAETHLTTNPVVIIAAGLLVGLGTRMANGCTSGHGVCGISRLSLRGIVATVFYILVGGIVMVLARHVLGWI
ncbi:YeeE/YedE thiosulfate transporter family protein [Fuscovulum ytuae]|uniref:YeeE/YedE thiosulfate transporter family protein n=1 Tax=Fuscovulum ytuae TaxID=3042299 RepID=A0ABY8QCI7_9RHOB|nr:YeeE/YedE thiosulfate transporter family protein [Fuscovulum sp. YMD61]WGV17987.1 YeeE/YedE thiosulfate transporter family protein [Fuscovulum sp. YMD61]